MAAVTAIVVLMTTAAGLMREYLAFKRDRLQAKKAATKSTSGVDDDQEAQPDA